jgi:hypothetical protein
MNDDQINDLKQFIAATVSQATSDLKTDVAGLKQSVQKIEQKIDDGFAGIGEAIDETHKHVDQQFSIVDARLTKLECQAA